MKITGLDVFRIDLPYVGEVYRLSNGRSYTSFEATIVEVKTDLGISGVGESTPFGSTYIAEHAGSVQAGIQLLAPAVLGLDPRCLDVVNATMDSHLVANPGAKTAIDIACWDIFGKSVGLPVCDLLGGRVEGSIPLISSISSDEPQTMRSQVARFRESGFKGHSIKVGASAVEGGPQLDAERIKSCLADKETDEWFLVDANGGLSVEHALRMLRLLPEHLDFVLEAPCASWAETHALRQKTSVPILLDELIQSDADLIHAVRHDLCDGVGLKVSKQGGLTAMRRQRDICAAAGLVMSVQETTGSEIAFSAIVHAAQSTPKHLLRCALDSRSMVSVSTAKFEAPIVGGGVQAPSLPGLGVTLDREMFGVPYYSVSV